MLKVYPAIIHEEDNSYWIDFPDLPGCQSCGDTMEELMANASEALGSYIAAKMECGIEIPEASVISEIDGEIKTYVTTDINKYRKSTKAVKKMLSIPEWLAKEAESQNISLSKVLQEALAEKLGLA